MRTRGRGFDCTRTSATQHRMLAVLACSCMAFLITRTVTALAVLSRSLVTVALWNGDHASVRWVSHKASLTSSPRSALLLTVCSCCNVAFHLNESCCCSVEYRLVPPHDFTAIPFKLYCPSLQNILNKQICKHCAAYFPSQVAIKKHQCAQAALQPTCRGRRANWSYGDYLQWRSCDGVWRCWPTACSVQLVWLAAVESY